MKKKEEKKGDNVLVIKLSEHKTPIFREVSSKPFIYFGKNNDYPDYLMKLYSRSAKHNAIVNQKAFYIFGQGSEEGKVIVNDEKETLDDVMRKAIIDFELFGGYALEAVWALGGKTVQLRHVNFSHIRRNFPMPLINFSTSFNNF